MTATLHQQLAAWRAREHHDHARFTHDRARVRQLLGRLRDARHPQPVRGVDLSNYQGHVDMHALRADGIRFVIRKATEGLGYQDPGFAQAMHDARAAGLIRGAYHFARPQPGRTGAQEADFFLSVARLFLDRGDLYPCLDIETTQLSAAETLDYVHSFTQHVRALTGWETILYTYPAFMRWPAMPNPLWIAGPDRPTAPQLPGFQAPVIWQNSFTGRLRGIAGNVDTNITDTRALRTITIGATR